MFSCSEYVLKVEDLQNHLPALPDEPRLYFKVEVHQEEQANDSANLPLSIHIHYKKT